MDFGVSVLTVVATAISAAAKLQEVFSRLQHAPDEIVSLLYEVQTVRIVLLDIDHKRQSASLWLDLTALAAIVRRADIVLKDVNDFVTKLAHLDAQEKLNFHRLRWYFAREEGQRYLRDLRNLRDTAVALISCASLSANIHANLSLQKVTALLERSLITQEHTHQSVLEQQRMTALGFETFERAIALLCSADRQPSTISRVHTISSVEDDAVLRRPLEQYESPLMLEHTPLRSKEYGSDLVSEPDTERERCPRDCPCACHNQQVIRTPKQLRNIAGHFSLRTSGFRLTGNLCTTTDCVQHAEPSLALQYFFPRWLLHRMIHVFAAGTSDPKMVLSVSRILSQDEPVFEMARSGDIAGLQRCFSARSASPSIVTEHGENLLQYAVAHAQPQTCRFLINAGSSPIVENKASSTPGKEAWDYVLRGAFHNDVLEEYRTIFADSGDLEERGFSIVHEYVLDLRKPDSFSAAVEKARDSINARDFAGRTPLHWAALRGNATQVEQLLRLGADPSIHDIGFGNTPLDYAVRQSSGECTRILLERGASPHTRTTCLWTPLYGCGAYRRSPLEDGHVESASHLLKWGARPGDRDEDGHDALIKAVRQDMPKLVTCLLDVGNAEVNTVDKNGVSAVAFGIRRQSHRALPIILGRKPNILTRDFKGNNILHEAAANANDAIVSILREAKILGPDPNAENLDGLTPMSIAQRRDPVNFLSAFSDLLTEVRVRNIALSLQTKRNVRSLDMEEIYAAAEAGYGSGSHEQSGSPTTTPTSFESFPDEITAEMVNSTRSVQSLYYDAPSETG